MDAIAPQVAPQAAPLDEPVEDGELHIASLVVQALVAQAAGAAVAIVAMPGARVHATSGRGKLVVTLEAGDAAALMAMIAGIQRIEGVVTATLVYQCADSLVAMNAEVPADA